MYYTLGVRQTEEYILTISRPVFHGGYCGGVEYEFSCPWIVCSSGFQSSYECSFKNANKQLITHDFTCTGKQIMK